MATDTAEKTSVLDWAGVSPVFKTRLREKPKPVRPSDGAIAMAQKSYAGEVNEDGETQHVMSHRFPTAEMAEIAADELKRAGAYTTPETTVTVNRGEKGDGEGDLRWVHWRAGEKRGRKS